MLESKEINTIGFKSQGGGAFDGGKLAASVGFADASFGVYLVEKDPPTCEPDNNDPEIVCPADVFTSTDADSCVATSVDLGTPPVATDFCGVDTVENDAPESFPLGETTVTWTITDTAGRTATCQQLVTVADVEAPTVMCAADIEVDADAGACVATNVDVPLPMSAADNCTDAFDLDFSNDAPMAFPIGDTIVTWTVNDESMNAGTCQITVTVRDVEPPTIMRLKDGKEKTITGTYTDETVVEINGRNMTIKDIKPGDPIVVFGVRSKDDGGTSLVATKVMVDRKEKEWQSTGKAKKDDDADDSAEDAAEGASEE